MLSLTSLHISYVIIVTVIIMVSLYGAYQFVEFDVMIFFWIIAFALGSSIILYGIKELCRRILWINIYLNIYKIPVILVTNLSYLMEKKYYISSYS